MLFYILMLTKSKYGLQQLSGFSPIKNVFYGNSVSLLSKLFHLSRFSWKVLSIQTCKKKKGKNKVENQFN